MAKNPTKRAGDITGRKAEALRDQNAEALRARAQELSLMTQVAQEERNEVVSLVPDRGVQQQGQVEVEIPTKTFRVNTNLESMTYGHGNHYTFEEGRTYKASKDLYDHLEEMGYIWH